MYLCRRFNKKATNMIANYPSVLLIYTGGTIGMIENPETGALENFDFDHLLKHVPELKRFNSESPLINSILLSTLRIWNPSTGPNL